MYTYKRGLAAAAAGLPMFVIFDPEGINIACVFSRIEAEILLSHLNR